MISLGSLWLPIVLGAVAVFVVSSLVHMVFKWHNAHYRKFANEDEVRAALRKGAPGPGQYMTPHCHDPKEQGTPEMQKKFEEGPIAVVYVGPNGPIKLGPFLGKWVAYSFIVSLIAGYVAHATLGPGAEYLAVFQVVGAAAWLAYAWQSPADSIWKSKPWSVTFGAMFDGLVYAALTAGAFAWLWPRGAA